MESKIYNKQGMEVGTVELPANIFGAKWNADMVHGVVTSMLSNARHNIAHTKGRGEVSGGGKKPWKQKGTGRSRHGSTRSPIWRKGGVTHGPSNVKDFSRKVNKKEKARALASILSRKTKENEIVFVDTFDFTSPKTKEASLALKNLSKVETLKKISWLSGNRALVLVSANDQAVKKSFRNIPSVAVDEVRNISPVEALKYQYVVFAGPEESIKILSGKMAE